MSGNPKIIYLTGRMRGIECYNIIAFRDAARKLREIGWQAINPHDADLAAGFDVMRYFPREHGLTWSEYPPEHLFNRTSCRRRNRGNVDKAEAMFVLNGGLGANGVRELDRAARQGKPVFFEEDGYPTPGDMPARKRETAQETIIAPEPYWSMVLDAEAEGRGGRTPDGRCKSNVNRIIEMERENDELKRERDKLRRERGEIARSLQRVFSAHSNACGKKEF